MPVAFASAPIVVANASLCAAIKMAGVLLPLAASAWTSATPHARQVDVDDRDGCDVRRHTGLYRQGTAAAIVLWLDPTDLEGPRLDASTRRLDAGLLSLVSHPQEAARLILAAATGVPG